MWRSEQLSVYIPHINSYEFKCPIYATCPNHLMCISDRSRLIYIQHMHPLASTTWWEVLFAEDNNANTDNDDSLQTYTHRQTDKNWKFYMLWLDKAKSGNNQNQSFHDQHTLPKWQLSEISPMKFITGSQTENWQKISLFKTTTIS